MSRLGIFLDVTSDDDDALAPPAALSQILTEVRAAIGDGSYPSTGQIVIPSTARTGAHLLVTWAIALTLAAGQDVLPGSVPGDGPIGDPPPIHGGAGGGGPFPRFVLRGATSWSEDASHRGVRA